MTLSKARPYLSSCEGTKIYRPKNRLESEPRNSQRTTKLATILLQNQNQTSRHRFDPEKDHRQNLEPEPGQETASVTLAALYYNQKHQTLD